VSDLKWLPEALRDLEELHDFLAKVSPVAARRAAAAILVGADRLAEHPRLGRLLDDERREHVIPFGAGAYILRYRLDPVADPIVIRVWHSREARE